MQQLKGTRGNPPVKGTRVIFYARVSTEDQNLSMQVQAAERLGTLPGDIFVEKLSAATKRRPQLRRAIKRLQPGDTFAVWRLDRLGRSVQDLLDLMKEIEGEGAQFKSLTENIDTGTAMGRFYFHMVAAMAEFERHLISERTRAGMAALKERGGRLGALPKISEKQWAEIERRLRDTPATVKQLAVRYKISAGLIHKRLGGKKALQRKRRRK